MLRVGRGDGDACRLLVERHLGRVVAFAARVLGSRSEAEDVAQEAFTRVWTSAASWRPTARFTTWLHRVALNLCLDRLQRRREAPLEHAAEPTDPNPSARDRLEEADVTRAVGREIAALPERQRVALALCHYQGLRNDEAAEIMDVTVDALESLLARARRTLRDRLRPVAAELLEAEPMARDDITLGRLEELLDAYGARPDRWPAGERDAALALVAASRDARARLDAAAALDTVLDDAPAVAPSAALAGRILAGAPRPRVVSLPRRRRIPIVAAVGLAAAASVMWLVRRSDVPPTLDPAAVAELEDYETPTDALLASTDPDGDDTLPAFGCDDPEVDCEGAEAAPERPSAAQPLAPKETLA